jgi:lysophospholipase L1-like esterase
LNEGRYTYFRDDTHWNAHGVDVAARAIAERLRELEADRH